MSGKLEEEAAREFVRLGALALLPKPFGPEQLLAALEASLLAVS
jgi:DNA-binding response OmpR family regulator